MLDMFPNSLMGYQNDDYTFVLSIFALLFTPLVSRGMNMDIK